MLATEEPGATPKAEDPGATPKIEEPGATPKVDEPGATPKVDEPPTEAAELRLELKRVNAESRDRRLKLAEYQKAERVAQEAEMTAADKLTARDQQIETMTTQMKASDDVIKSLTAAIESQLTALKTDLKIPEYVSDAIKDKEPLAQLEYLTANRAAFTQQPKAPNINAAKKGSGKNKIDEKAIRSRFGI